MPVVVHAVIQHHAAFAQVLTYFVTSFEQHIVYNSKENGTIRPSQKTAVTFYYTPRINVKFAPPPLAGRTTKGEAQCTSHSTVPVVEIALFLKSH